MFEWAVRKGAQSGRWNPSDCGCAGDGTHVMGLERFLVHGPTYEPRTTPGFNSFRMTNVCMLPDGGIVEVMNQVETEWKEDPLLDPAVKQFLSGHSKRWAAKGDWAKYGQHFSRGDQL